MKRLWAFLLTFVISLSVCACSNKTTEDATHEEDKTEEITENEEDKLPSGTKIELTVDNYLDYMEWTIIKNTLETLSRSTEQLVLKEGYYFDSSDMVTTEDPSTPNYAIQIKVAGDHIGFAVKCNDGTLKPGFTDSTITFSNSFINDKRGYYPEWNMMQSERFDDEDIEYTYIYSKEAFIDAYQQRYSGDANEEIERKNITFDYKDIVEITGTITVE